MRDQRTNLTYWLPKVQATGVPTPRTIIVPVSDSAQADIYRLFDGHPPGDATHALVAEIAAAAQALGYPAFLRTGLTSGKHDWKRTCYVADPAKVGEHVFGLVEFSLLADMLGLPFTEFAVREYLPVQPVGSCPGFGDMPVNREFRFFIRDGKAECHHAYWPLHALEMGDFQPHDPAFDYDAFADAGEDLAHLTALAERAAQNLEGYWSVDLLPTSRGWYVTDLAEGDRSYHDEPCAHRAEPSRDGA